MECRLYIISRMKVDFPVDPDNYPLLVSTKFGYCFDLG